MDHKIQRWYLGNKKPYRVNNEHETSELQYASVVNMESVSRKEQA